jgi:soluble lytic murein transglycosylase-like protein
MTLIKRLCVGASALVAAASIAAQAAADAPRPLSASDVRAYQAAFQASDEGDFVGAEISATGLSDKSLLGYISFRQLMHPTAHKASFEELCGWLLRFRDLPAAEKVFSLASKRKPADAAQEPPVPEVAGLNSARSEVTFPARDAFYSGDVKRAYELAMNVGDRWIAGLSAYRLKDYVNAQDYFAQVARDEEEDAWLRAAGAYWAARTSATLGDLAESKVYLRLAAQSPQTFYGMIAERQLQLSGAQAATGEVVQVSDRAPEREIVRFVQSNRRAHRAAALVQIGRYDEARQELRAGLALARSKAERRNWEGLVNAIGPSVTSAGASSPRYQVLGDYQVPPLEPASGFTVDKALVYAIVRQESAFNPQAVSPVGAVGLMQLMPASAALATGNEKLKVNHKPLFDPATNLRAGQDYLAWLMDRGVGTDLLRIVAAYNGGPGAVLNTAQRIGEDDSLLLIECLPALETRNYVEKVMAAYWTYKRIFGEETKSLDAIAGGAKRIDYRLDLVQPRQPQPAPELLQIGNPQTEGSAALD